MTKNYFHLWKIYNSQIELLGEESIYHTFFIIFCGIIYGKRRIQNIYA